MQLDLTNQWTCNSIAAWKSIYVRSQTFRILGRSKSCPMVEAWEFIRTLITRMQRWATIIKTITYSLIRTLIHTSRPMQYIMRIQGSQLWMGNNSFNYLVNLSPLFVNRTSITLVHWALAQATRRWITLIRDHNL